jgi:hypothetical protein
MATLSIDLYGTLYGFLGQPGSPSIKFFNTVHEIVRQPREHGSPSFIQRFCEAYTLEPTTDEANLIEGLLETLHFGWVSKAGPDMKHGIWDHFKGGIYLSEGLGLSADTGELEVEYVSLLHGTRHHRRCSQWNEIVLWPDDKYRSRFVLRQRQEAPPFKVPKVSEI